MSGAAWETTVVYRVVSPSFILTMTRSARFLDIFCISKTLLRIRVFFYFPNFNR